MKCRIRIYFELHWSATRVSDNAETVAKPQEFVNYKLIIRSMPKLSFWINFRIICHSLTIVEFQLIVKSLYSKQYIGLGMQHAGTPTPFSPTFRYGGVEDQRDVGVAEGGVAAPHPEPGHHPTHALLEKFSRISLYLTDDAIAKLYVT